MSKRVMCLNTISHGVVVTTDYTVRSAGHGPLITRNLEEAIREWDHRSFDHSLSSDKPLQGGIEYQSTSEDGCIVADGWILHVRDSHVYMLPRMVLS
jgi:hypothetical protein